jgi:putative ABC transport system permease protein
MTWLADARFAGRTFRKNPGFTLFAVLTLALGLGANVAIFSFVDGLLLKPLAYPEPDRIVQIWEKPPRGRRNGVSALNFLDWRDQATSFTAMAARTGDSLTLTGRGEPRQVRAAVVSAPYFDVLGIKAALGRTFAPDEDRPGRDRVIVLSHRFWVSQLGGDAAIVGRSLTLNGDAYTVVGVLEQGGEFDRTFAEVLVPLALDRARVVRNFHYLSVLARLKPGVPFERAQSEMSGIAGRIAEQYPDIKKGWGATVDRLVDRVVNDRLRLSLLVMMAAVGAVLMIGCANLANLLLARATLRTREMALRAALGAGRGRLIRQLLTESVLLSGLGAAGGLVLGFALFHGIRGLLPEFFLPAQTVVGLDWRVVSFLSALALVTGILFGLAPALQGTRRDAASVLKEGGRGAAGSAGRRLMRHALVVSEVALAFVLLVGAGLLIRSFNKLMSVNPGFDSTNIVTMSVPLTMDKDVDGPRLTTYLNSLLDRVRGVPGVQHAAMTSALPMQGWGFGMPFRLDGMPRGNDSERQPCFFKIVTPDYFGALGMALRRGRTLSATDAAGRPPVTVVNETFARRFLRGGDAIGRRVFVEQIVTGRRELGAEIPWEVVGVVADEKVGSLDSTDAGIYVAFEQSPIVGVSLLVKGRGELAGFTKSIQTAVWEVNPSQALDNVRTLEQIKSRSVGDARLQMSLLGLFAVLALLLAAIGIYGVLSYVTAQRTQELGVRAALGASAIDQVRLVVLGALVPVGAGILLGLTGSFLLTRMMQTLLFETTPTDPATMIGVGLILTTVALVACYVPARRASRVDPIVALRHE